MIAEERLNRQYFLRLFDGNYFSNSILHYLLAGIQPRRMNGYRSLLVVVQGIKRGLFTMQMQWAALRGEDRAARFISGNQFLPKNVTFGVVGYAAGGSDS